MKVRSTERQPSGEPHFKEYGKVHDGGAGTRGQGLIIDRYRERSARCRAQDSLDKVMRLPRSPLDIISAIRKRKANGAVGPHFRGAPAGGSGDAVGRANRQRRAPGPLAQLVNRWWTRLLEAVYQGSLSEQEAQYQEGSTGRDYLWNTIGTTIWGFTFPLLTIVATQLAGAEGAGMFSLAFVVGTLLMIASNYGIRNFQVSDIDERCAFSSYQANRWITGAIALAAGALYCALRGYDPQMIAICQGVFVYKVVDGVADVYEGRLQQADKLYLAGISQALRSVAAVVSFSILLFVFRSLEIASIGMAVVAVASLILVTVPLALFETEKSRRATLREIGHLFAQGFPLFAALFIFNLIESMPKFVMEGAIAYENQLYFNALYFPAQGILLATGFIYKPQLVRLASIWANPRKRRRFDLVVIAVMAVILALCIGVAFFMGWLGISLMSIMYGLDFERFRVLAYLMVCAGGVTAAIDFLYAIVTVLRRAGDVMRLYLIALAASVAAPLILVNLFGLTGAVVSYLAVMVLLLGLLVWQYVRIRLDITQAQDPFAGIEELQERAE